VIGINSWLLGAWHSLIQATRFSIFLRWTTQRVARCHLHPVRPASRERPHVRLVLLEVRTGQSSRASFVMAGDICWAANKNVRSIEDLARAIHGVAFACSAAIYARQLFPGAANVTVRLGIPVAGRSVAA